MYRSTRILNVYFSVQEQWLLSSYPNIVPLGYTNGQDWTVWGKGLTVFDIVLYLQDWSMTCSFERCWVAQRHQENLCFLKQSLTELRVGPRIREVQQPAKSFWNVIWRHSIILKLPCVTVIMLQHNWQLPRPLWSSSLCASFVYSLCAFSVYKFRLLNIFADHKYNENLTHAQTTSTRPSCSPNRYKSENSAWDRG